jgi:phosphoadenosine phosphosulfate reductase
MNGTVGVKPEPVMKETAVTKKEVAQLRMAAEAWSAAELLKWAFQTFGYRVAISSGFGAEGMVLIDIASHLQEKFRLFTLDTQFLFPETYNLMNEVEQRYGITIERIFPLLSPEEQEHSLGSGLWRRNPDQCCNVRKVEPLRRKLSELQAWVTSIRRDQTAARSGAGKIEWDENFGLVKINPVADWSSKQVWDYIREHNTPYNPLHDRNYPSIGCIHCTRAVSPEEDPRAGRWSGYSKTECGLHQIEP